MNEYDVRWYRAFFQSAAARATVAIIGPALVILTVLFAVGSGVPVTAPAYLSAWSSWRSDA